MPVLGSTAASSSATTPTGNPNYFGLQPVGDHTNMCNAGRITEAALSGTYRIRHIISAATKTIAFVYSNTLEIEADNGNPITIRAAVYRASDNATLRLTFGGKTSVTLEPGADIVTDPISCPVAAGGEIQSITYVSVTGAGMTWPGTVAISRAFTHEGYAVGRDNTDASPTGWDYGNRTTAFGPALVLGSTGLRRPIIAVTGDSIAGGSGDTTLYGLWERALSGTYSFAMGTMGGVTSGSISLIGGCRHRVTWWGGSTHAFAAWGTNDLNGATTVSIATSILNGWKILASLGAKVYQMTLLPKTTSTDGFATTGNQTVTIYESQRLALNTWFRNGGKVDGSGVPVFDGSGTASVSLTGVIEIADVLETARDSGKWKSPGMTADGVHPTTAGHTLAATTIAAFASTLTVS